MSSRKVGVVAVAAVAGLLSASPAAATTIDVSGAGNILDPATTATGATAEFGHGAQRTDIITRAWHEHQNIVVVQNINDVVAVIVFDQGHTGSHRFDDDFSGGPDTGQAWSHLSLGPRELHRDRGTLSGELHGLSAKSWDRWRKSLRSGERDPATARAARHRHGNDTHLIKPGSASSPHPGRRPGHLAWNRPGHSPGADPGGPHGGGPSHSQDGAPHEPYGGPSGPAGGGGPYAGGTGNPAGGGPGHPPGGGPGGSPGGGPISPPGAGPGDPHDVGPGGPSGGGPEDPYDGEPNDPPDGDPIYPTGGPDDPPGWGFDDPPTNPDSPPGGRLGPTAAQVPLPSSLLLLGVGALGASAVARRCRRRK